MIGDSALAAYANLLEDAGFTIYEPVSSRGLSRYFRYSQMCEGRECFGYVQKEYVGSGYSHTMPIRPSIKDGSSMWVGGVENELTVEAARKVALPLNHNPLVGWQYNYDDPRFSHMYQRRLPVES